MFCIFVRLGNACRTARPLARVSNSPQNSYVPLDKNDFNQSYYVNAARAGQYTLKIGLHVSQESVRFT